MAVMTYPGVYRAACQEVLVDRIRVQIPQLFATEMVTIFECAGPRPSSGDEGWVSFESGLAERPIWVGSESKGSSNGTVGPPPDSGGVIAYRHVQSTAATTWVIPHGLSFRPNVTVVDSTGRAIVPEINYTDAVTVVCTFSAAVGGEAYLS